MFETLAPYIIAGLLFVTGYLFVRWLAAIGRERHWKASAEISFRRNDELSEQIAAMEAEGCRAMGALENIFNGVTAGGMPHSKLVKKVADVATDALVMCAPCGHKEEVDDLREELANELHDVALLCGIASEVYDTITRGRISKPNTMAFEILSVVDELATEERNEAFEEGRAEVAAERDAALARADEATRLADAAYVRLVAERSQRVTCCDSLPFRAQERD